MCDPLRQSECRRVILENKAAFAVIIDTRIQEEDFARVVRGLFPAWNAVANYFFSPRGRVWVLWDPSRIAFTPTGFSFHAIHGHLQILGGQSFQVSCVYAGHSTIDRRPLWEELVGLSNTVGEFPWLVMGDFNAILHQGERDGGSTVWSQSANEMRNCLDEASLFDLRFFGHRFTWSNRQEGDRRIHRKIDRVLTNGQWIGLFPFAEAVFHQPGMSDHSAVSVDLGCGRVLRPPFRFFNMWVSHPRFLETVGEAWNTSVDGFVMYQVARKLKVVKGALKTLNRSDFSDISRRVHDAKAALDSVQDELQGDRTSVDLARQEKVCIQLYEELRTKEECFFKQKSRIRWLKEGDLNTRFFHSSVVDRQHRNRITSIMDEEGGVIQEGGLLLLILWTTLTVFWGLKGSVIALPILSWANTCCGEFLMRSRRL